MTSTSLIVNRHDVNDVAYLMRSKNVFTNEKNIIGRFYLNLAIGDRKSTTTP